jgi:glutamate racemase
MTLIWYRRLEIIFIGCTHSQLIVNIIEMSKSDKFALSKKKKKKKKKKIKTPEFNQLRCSGKSDSTHHFFRNACTKSGPLRFSFVTIYY